MNIMPTKIKKVQFSALFFSKIYLIRDALLQNHQINNGFKQKITVSQYYPNFIFLN